MAETSIEWATHVWNPTTGCDRVSPGCDHCYALTLAARLKRMGSAKYQRDGDSRTSGPGFGLTVHGDALSIPLRWRQPRRVFVNSMSDLFHDDVPVSFIAEVFAVMALSPQHTFQVLTKRHGRMRSLLAGSELHETVWRYAHALVNDGIGADLDEPPWPLPNVWLGVSVENQQWADIRVPALLDTPAAIRWLSCEPLLGPVDLSRWLGPVDWPPCWDEHAPSAECSRCIQPEWVVVGGESGPGARPMHPDWARSLRDQCAAAAVPYFHKQWGEWAPVGPLYNLGDDSDAAEDAILEAAHLEVVEGRRVIELETSGHIADGYQPTDPRTWLMARVGKKAAGRLLDGQLHDAYPTPKRLKAVEPC